MRQLGKGKATSSHRSQRARAKLPGAVLKSKWAMSHTKRALQGKEVREEGQIPTQLEGQIPTQKGEDLRKWGGKWSSRKIITIIIATMIYSIFTMCQTLCCQWTYINLL